MKSLLLILTAIPAFAGYGHVVSVTIAHGQVGGSTLTNYPVFVCANGVASTNCDFVAHVNLSVPNLKTLGNGGAVTSTSGYDVNFFSDNACSSALNFELVKNTYVATTGFGEWHVQIPSISSSVDTVFYMCFGNSAVTTDQSSTSTWASSFNRVWHLPNGGTLTVDDSTPNASGTIIVNATATTGEMDGAAAFNGTARITGGATVTPLPTTGTSSLSAWVKSTSSASQVALGFGTGSSIYLGFGVPASGRPYLGDAGTLVSSSSATLNDGNWHLLVGTYNGSNSRKLYLDGALVGSDNGSLTAGSPGTSNIGATASAGLLMTGSVDEARIYNVELTSGWITADFNNQSTPSSFYTFGADAPVGHSYSYVEIQ